MNYREFKSLIGKKLLSVSAADHRVRISTDAGSFFLEHVQDCCESVVLVTEQCPELIPSEVIAVDESASELPPEDAPEDESKYEPESQTWSRFEIRTAANQKFVFIWHGTSNGYYSEGVSFTEI